MLVAMHYSFRVVAVAGARFDGKLRKMQYHLERRRRRLQALASQQV